MSAQKQSDNSQFKDTARDETQRSARETFTNNVSRIAIALSNNAQVASVAAQAVASVSQTAMPAIKAAQRLARSMSQAGASTTTGFAAATAQVTAMAGALAATGANGAIIAASIMSAMTVAGPFVVLAVLGSVGLNSVTQVVAALGTFNSETSVAISNAIEHEIAIGATQADAIKLASIHLAELNSHLSHINENASGISGNLVAQSTTMPPHHEPVVQATTIVSPENATIKMQVIASGAEAGDKLAYSIDGDAHGWKIDVATGVLTHDAFDFEAGQPAPITIRVTDFVGLSTIAVVTPVITNVNEAPTAPTLSNVNITDHERLVGTLSATDPDAGDRVTYELGSQSSNFAVRGDQLIYIGSDQLDLFLPTIESLLIYAVDTHGLRTGSMITVTVTPVNDAPTAIEVDTVFDGATLTATLHSSDPERQHVTYYRDGVALQGDVIVWTAAQLAAGAPTVSITARDPQGLETSAVTIDPPHIASVDAHSHPTPPAILSYSLSVLPENQTATMTVTAYDAIDGVVQKAYAIAPQDYEALATHSINVDVTITNSAGLSAHANHVVHIQNVNEAPIFAFADPIGSLTDTGATQAIVVRWTDPEQGALTQQYTVGGYNLGGAGDYVLRASITDAGGLTATHDIAYHIDHINRAPSIRFDHAEPIDGFSLVTFVASDPDGSLFTWGGLGQQTTYSNNSSVVTTALDVGHHFITVTDADGATFVLPHDVFHG